jgi:hypothetical protein
LPAGFAPGAACEGGFFLRVPNILGNGICIGIRRRQQLASAYVDVSIRQQIYWATASASAYVDVSIRQQLASAYVDVSIRQQIFWATASACGMFDVCMNALNI